MGAMKDVYTAAIERLHALIAQLEEEGHVLASDLRKELDKLRGEVPAFEAEAKADAEQVAHDVQAAAQDAASDVEQAVTPAPETPTA